MSAHTPGPWERRWTHTSYGERTEETGRIVHQRLGTICHLVMADDVDANARLIAAAPDLLEALEQMVASAPPHPVEHPSMSNAWAVARAAIAKARGGK